MNVFNQKGRKCEVEMDRSHRKMNRWNTEVKYSTLNSLKKETTYNTTKHKMDRRTLKFLLFFLEATWMTKKLPEICGKGLNPKVKYVSLNPEKKKKK